MKRKLSRLLATIMALVFCFSVMLTGCGGGSGDSAQDSTKDPVTSSTAADTSADTNATQLSWQKDTSPFTFDMYFFGAWGTGYPWRGSLVEKYITEATGVTPNIIIPTGNEKEYLNVMIASNDLPDAMVLEWASPETKKLIQSGNILAVDDLAAAHAPELMDMIPDEIKSYHKQEDGKLYYLPSFFSSKEEFDEGLEKHNARPLFIQKGIYEGLGSPVVDTPEKFLQLLKDIKAKYPDVKTFAIEPPVDVNQWGLAGSYTLQYFAGIFAPETLAKDQYLENDKIKMIFESPNYIEAVRFLNKIYNEGLISVDTLMMKHENFGEKTDSAQFAVTGAFPIDIWKTHNPRILSLTKDEGKTYMPLEFFKYNGKEPQYAGGRGAGWVGSMVTKNAENPERIIRYFQYGWSDEGQLTNLFGKKGETYEEVDGRPQYTADILKELDTDAANFANKYGFESRLVMWRSKWAGLQKIAMAPQAYTDYLNSVKNYGVDIWDMGLDNLDPDTASNEGVAYAKIKNIWNKYLSKMILAKNDAEFDASYQEAMKEINDAGLEKVKDVMTQNHLKDVAKKKGN